MRQILALLLSAAGAHPQAPSEKQDLQISGHAGFSGLVERGEWAPVVIDLDHRGKEDVDLVLSVVWAQPGAVQPVERPTLSSLGGMQGPIHRFGVPIGARSRKRLSLTLRAPDVDRLNVWVVAEHARSGKTLASGEILARSVDEDKRLIVTVGNDRPGGLALPGLTPAAATPEHLPEDWRGYASVDTLVWLDARASDLRSQAQLDAIAYWLAAGGRLVVARSSEVGLTGTPLAELLPVSVRGGRELPSLSGLEALAGVAPTGRALVLDAVPGPRSAILASQDGIALVVAGRRGLGRTIFCGADPSKEPFASWKDAPRFWRALLPSAPRPARTPPDNPPTGSWRPPQDHSFGSPALARLAGQFPDVAPPAVGGLFVLIIAYLVVVGPFDYFLLRWLKRLELTWLTFPAYVAGFTLLILVAGGAFIERAAYQREMTVEDHLADVGLVRSRSVSSVLAPRGLIYELRDAEPVSANYLFNSFQSSGLMELGNPVVLRDPAMFLPRWSVQRGATAVATSDRMAPGGLLSFRVRRAAGETVELDVKNGTGRAFASAWLVREGAVYRMSALAPGDAPARGERRHASVESWLADLTEGAPAPSVDVEFDGVRPGGTSAAALDHQTRAELLRLSFAVRGAAGFSGTVPLPEPKRPVLFAWESPAKASVSFLPLPDRLSGVRLVRAFEEPR